MEKNETKLNTRILPTGDRLQSFYSESCLPPQYLFDEIYLTPAAIDKGAFKALQKIWNNIECFFSFSKGSLYLCSHNVGNGKTSWAIKLMRHYMIECACYYDLKCYFISVPKLLTLKRQSVEDITAKRELNETVRLIKADHLVIFDDLAMTRLTEADELFLFDIIDDRYMRGKVAIYTSNVYPAELSSMIGERLADRIVNDEKTIRVCLRGGSRRGTQTHVAPPAPVKTTKNEEEVF